MPDLQDLDESFYESCEPAISLVTLPGIHKDLPACLLWPPRWLLPVCTRFS